MSYRSRLWSLVSGSDNLNLLLKIFSVDATMSRGSFGVVAGSPGKGRCDMDRSRAEAFRVLGIPVDSDRDAVARAYRTLARATHPDISDDPDAADRFATVAAAYRLVSRDPATASITARIHAPGPGDGGWARGPAGVEDGTAWGVPVGGSWGSPMVTVLRGRGHGQAVIVAGPAWVSPPRGPESGEVRGG
jgi:hypothetical protein